MVASLHEHLDVFFHLSTTDSFLCLYLILLVVVHMPCCDSIQVSLLIGLCLVFNLASSERFTNLIFSDFGH